MVRGLEIKEDEEKKAMKDDPEFPWYLFLLNYTSSFFALGAYLGVLFPVLGPFTPLYFSLSLGVTAALTGYIYYKWFASHEGPKASTAHQVRRAYLPSKLRFNIDLHAFLGPASGAMIGAAIGSLIVPGAGLIIGGLIGWGVGGVAVAVYQWASSRQELAETDMRPPRKPFAESNWDVYIFARAFVGGTLGVLFWSMVMPGVAVVLGIAALPAAGLAIATLVGAGFVVSVPYVWALGRKLFSKEHDTELERIHKSYRPVKDEDEEGEGKELDANTIDEKSAWKRESQWDAPFYIRWFIGAQGGAALGAAVGTLIAPGPGTAVGAAVGWLSGAAVAWASPVVFDWWRHWRKDLSGGRGETRYNFFVDLPWYLRLTAGVVAANAVLMVLPILIPSLVIAPVVSLAVIGFVGAVSMAAKTPAFKNMAHKVRTSAVCEWLMGSDDTGLHLLPWNMRVFLGAFLGLGLLQLVPVVGLVVGGAAVAATFATIAAYVTLGAIATFVLTPLVSKMWHRFENRRTGKPRYGAVEGLQAEEDDDSLRLPEDDDDGEEQGCFSGIRRAWDRIWEQRQKGGDGVVAAMQEEEARAEQQGPHL